MNDVVTTTKATLPEPVARRGIGEAQWRTLMNNLYPGAKSDSVLMVWDYCVARKLDPLKKPCHIVPMRVGDTWRDVVMPGIYEYRTTATRTGLYLGHSKPAYGPLIEYLGQSVPEWCEITVYRWNKEAQLRAEYPVQLIFSECCATKKDKQSGEVRLNQRWATAPQQMLTKCTEAAALREAFPDELGGTHTADEMDGQQAPEVVPKGIDPRPDTSNIPASMIDDHVGAITDILASDKEETEIAQMLRDYIAEYLQKFDELYSAVFDALAKRGVIKKAQLREYLKVGLDTDRGQTHT